MAKSTKKMKPEPEPEPEPMVMEDTDPASLVMYRQRKITPPEQYAHADKPVFTVSEVAKTFYGRSPHWIRWLERVGRLDVNGKSVMTPRTQEGARTYTLAEVARMAETLLNNEAIDQQQYETALVVAQSIALVWGYLPLEAVLDTHCEGCGCEFPEVEEVEELATATG